MHKVTADKRYNKGDRWEVLVIINLSSKDLDTGPPRYGFCWQTQVYPKRSLFRNSNVNYYIG